MALNGMALLRLARERVLGNPRSSCAAVLGAVLVGLLWAGAGAITALTAEVSALNGLVQALADGWHALMALPVLLWLLGKRDAA